MVCMHEAFCFLIPRGFVFVGVFVLVVRVPCQWEWRTWIRSRHCIQPRSKLRVRKDQAGCICTVL